MEDLPELDGPHRQRRPDDRGGEGVAQRVDAVVREPAPLVVGLSRGVLLIELVEEIDALVAALDKVREVFD